MAPNFKERERRLAHAGVAVLWFLDNFGWELNEDQESGERLALNELKKRLRPYQSLFPETDLRVKTQ